MKHFEVLITALLGAWPILLKQLPDHWLSGYWLISSGLFIFGLYWILWSYMEKIPVYLWSKFIDEDLIEEKILLTGSPIKKTRKSAQKWLVKARKIIWPDSLKNSLRKWNSGSVAEGILSVTNKIIINYNDITDNEIERFVSIFYERQIVAENSCEFAAYLIINKKYFPIVNAAIYILENYLNNLKKESRISILLDIYNIDNAKIFSRILDITKQLNLLSENGLIRTLQQKKKIFETEKNSEWDAVIQKINEILPQSYEGAGKTIVQQDLVPSLSPGATL